MNNAKLTVQDVLSRNTFACARVVAGKNGLNRPVKWSHILEVQDFDPFINGGELILTTGVSLPKTLSGQLSYIKKLIEKNTAGLCLEAGTHISEIPAELVVLANRHDFPIIVFDEIVKFVEITQDLHTLIISGHHRRITELDELSSTFVNLSLTSNGILKILRELYDYFRQPAFFIAPDMKPYYYPTSSKETEGAIRQEFTAMESSAQDKRFFSAAEKSFAAVPVRVLGQVWGTLCLEVDNTADEFFFLVLDRAGVAISQILLRNRTIEERKQQLEDETVRSLLNGCETNSDSLQSFMPEFIRGAHFRIVTIQAESPGSVKEMEWEELKLQRTMLTRTLFRKYGFFPAVSASENEIAVIAHFHETENQRLDVPQLMKLISELEHSLRQHPVGAQWTFGISRPHNQHTDAAKGYQETLETLFLQRVQITASCFHEELGILRLLLQLSQSGFLESYVQDHLGPILEQEDPLKTSLLETLSVYLECSGVKKDTADRLFIARQTLYQRLEKLENLLGAGFMESSNRLALEVAIHAHRLLNSGSHQSLQFKGAN